MDLASGDVERPGMVLEQIGVIALPRVSYIRWIDPYGTRPFGELCREVRAQAWRYFNLVVDPTSPALEQTAFF